MNRLLQVPLFVRWGAVLDTAAAWRWLALLAVALWPTAWWMAKRLSDGSDDPLGLLALAALALLVWRQRSRLRPSPRLGLHLLALAGVVLATAARGEWPDLLVALIGLVSLAIGLLAFLPHGVPAAPVVGLAVLSLPLLASLQFYAGYPLRVVTAEVSRWLLSGFHAVERTGTTLLVDGRMVIVDAPCSGVQMVWLGYFTACAVALATGLEGRRFIARLPFVGLLVLAANVVRNTLLVAAEGAGSALEPWAHETVGLAVLALACAGIAQIMARRGGGV